MSHFSAWIEKNKALWTRVYDEVIAPDLEEEWKKREEAHKEELKQKEVKQQALLNHLENEIFRTSHLTFEKEELKKQLEDLSKNALLETGPDQAVAVASTVSTDDHIQLANKFNDLSKKYQDLSQKIKYLERKNTAVMQKNKDMKESVRAWQEYADRQSGRQRSKGEMKPDDPPRLSAIPQIEESRPHMPSSPRSVVTVRTPLSLADHGPSSPTPIAPFAGEDVEDEDAPVSPGVQIDPETNRPGSRSGSITPKPSNRNRSSPQEQEESTELPGLKPSSIVPGGYAGRRLQSYLQAANPSSSQTTEDESTEHISRQTQLTTGDGDNDDMPEFVSARSLKRKRGQSSKIDMYGHRSSDGTPVKPFRVKEEPTSSPPRTHSLMRKETIDLDDPTSTMLQTPRRPRRLPPVLPATTSTARHHRSSSAPLSQAVKLEEPHSDRMGIRSNDNLRLEVPETTNAEARAYSEPSDPTQGVVDVLRHLDPNINTEAHEERSPKRAKRAESRKENVPQIFAESGEEPPPVDENTGRLAPLIARAKLNRKLHSLKSPQSYNIAPAQTPTPVAAKIKVEQNPTPLRSSASATHTPLPRTRLHNPQSEARYVAQESPDTDGRPQWRMKDPEPRSSVRNHQTTPPVKQGRLRQKPVSELSLQDFKPNPAYNQGYTYAFSETVRKRGDRACLPGCTNPDCCGSTFRTFAEVQAPLSASQEEALLEDYLGEAYDNMNLTQMSTEERQELVLQARTKKLAKDAGKHREAYERRRTPPGFWRMDFPTTQEQQEDREKSKEQEKRNVHERWIEAHRKGGKWLFRDE